jgi:DHA3 family macrolide efflux protein-like MFS transporter
MPASNKFRGGIPVTEPTREKSLRPFFVLWSAQTLSLVGSGAVQFALIWWLTAQTGSATVLATATLLGLLPQVLLGPVIGTLIDRWNRKLVMLFADGLVAAAALVLAVLFVSGAANTEHVLALLFVRALGSAFHAPAMMASTSLMVPENLLTKIQGLNQSVQGLLLIVAAPLGALLYAVLPMAGVMMVDVGTALIAIVPLLFIHVPQPAASDSEADGASIWRETLDGFHYLRHRSGHLTLVFISAAINMLLVPAFSLLPLLVLERLQGNATQLGWITSSFGVGMLAGGVLLGVWGGFSRRILTTLTGLIALGVAVLVVGLTPTGSFLWALGGMVAVGFVVPLVNGPVHAIMQATIPPELQGRVFALLTSLAGASAPLGLLVAAPVAEAVGVGTWYLAGGAMCIVMAITGFLASALMRIEEPAESADRAGGEEVVPDPNRA